MLQIPAAYHLIVLVLVSFNFVLCNKSVRGNSANIITTTTNIARRVTRRGLLMYNVT